MVQYGHLIEKLTTLLSPRFQPWTVALSTTSGWTFTPTRPWNKVRKPHKPDIENCECNIVEGLWKWNEFSCSFCALGRTAPFTLPKGLTHQKLCTALRSRGPSAKPVCKNAWWFWFVFQRLWTTSLGASVTPNTQWPDVAGTQNSEE